jgi:hypothetical protein
MFVPYTAKDWMVRFVLAIALGVTIPFGAVVFAQSSDAPPSILERLQNKQLEVDRRVMARQQKWIPEGFNSEDAAMHPIIYWRAWLNQPWPVHRVFILLLVFSFVAIGFQLICPKLVAKSQVVYEQKWLRSLGAGLLVLTLGAVLTGVLARTGQYLAMANLLLGAIEVTSLFGLSVAAKSIGKGFLTIVRLQKFLKGDLATQYVPILVGMIICGLMLLLARCVPFLPGFGARLLSLIAYAGSGALLISGKMSTGNRDE